ncbi:MAG: phosphoribosylanthranilate isomerase [Pseudomonadota bacterium]
MNRASVPMEVGGSPVVKVKICCISSAEEASLARAAGADYLGLVGPMPSGPGTLELDEISAITARMSAEECACAVHLSAAEGAVELAAASRVTGARTLQIVRHVSVEVHRELALIAPDVTRWQVIHVEGTEAVEAISAYSPHVDGFLLDSGTPTIGRLGGTGKVHDWSISRACVTATWRPVFLAGGLRPENVGEAIRAVRPHGVDICTGVRSDGMLDTQKLRRFLAAIAEAA